MRNTNFDPKKIIYPVLAAVIIGCITFTADAALTTQQLKRDQKQLEKDIVELKTDVEKLENSTVDNVRFNDLCTQISEMNKSIKVIEQRTYDMWKIGGQK